MITAFQPSGATPGTMPAANTQSPIARCIDLLRSIVIAGKDLTQGLQNRIRHQSAARAPLRLLEAGERRLTRMRRAIAYAVTLIAKLQADPAYRGEPSRIPQSTRTPYDRDRPEREDFDDFDAPYCPLGRYKPFERLFAGKSLSQIIERIRRDLGLCIELGPWCETTLNAPQPDPDPPPPPLIALTRRRWRATMLPPGSPSRTQTRAEPSWGRSATGPP